MVMGVVGMVGSYLIEELLCCGYEVYVFDIVLLEKVNNLCEVCDYVGLYYIQGDICDLLVIEGFFWFEVMVFYYFVLVVGVWFYMEDLLSLIDIVIIGMCKFIELCDWYWVCILFILISEVYGCNLVVLWKEIDDCVFGVISVDCWSYLISKVVVEYMLFGIYCKFGLLMLIV